MRDKLWSATYWADRLKETEEEAAPILRKINIDLHSTKNLTVEEQWKLQAVLSAYGSYARLLHEDMHQPDPEPVPFWKKLLNKYW